VLIFYLINELAWSDPLHRLWRTLEKDALPWLGKRSITDIKAVDVLNVLRRVEDRGAIETAHRVLSIINQIMRYAVQTGRLEFNPARDLTGALPPAQVTHHAAITDPKEVGGWIATCYRWLPR